MSKHSCSRRRFINDAAAVSAGLALSEFALANPANVQQENATQAGSIPRRKFGRHSDQISALGLGGHHLGNAASLEDATTILHEAVHNGITFCDKRLGVLTITGRKSGWVRL